MRIKTRWSKQGKERTLEEKAGVLAFVSWRIAQNVVLNLENENYQTETLKDRLNVIFEMVAFLVAVCDRITYESFNEEERGRIVTELAQQLLRHMRENLDSAAGLKWDDVGDEYIQTLNARLGDYAEFDFANGQPGFNFRRYLGERITEVMGERDQKWVQQQIMDIEVPTAMENLQKGLKSIIPQEEGEGK